MLASIEVMFLKHSSDLSVSPRNGNLKIVPSNLEEAAEKPNAPSKGFN